MATGDTLNMAARLEQSAAPGEIVVGPAAHATTASAVDFEPLGSLTLAGKADPVIAWRVVGLSVELGGRRGVAGLSAPMTGRDDEMRLLAEAARRAERERKAILFTLFGAPGVGKSRLVRELGVQLAAQGWRELRGRCLPYGDGITYWPVGEMIRAASDLHPELPASDAMARLRAACPDEAVADRLAAAIGLVADAAVQGEGMDREIAFAFRRFLERRASEGPLLLVFEDIHWAEPVMLDLIEQLATWIRGVPVVIVCPSRPELLDRRPNWGGGRMEATRIQLEPLNREESIRLVGALLAIDSLPASVRDRILERAEGNPLFVEETIRMLIDAAAIVRKDDRWVAVASADAVAVPATVEALIRARLDTLPREERALLQGASVIGRTFQRTALAAVAGDGPRIQFDLEDALLRDLIVEEPLLYAERSYRFRHILIRDVAYASLPKARRADLHQRVAAWLRAWAGERVDEFAEVEAYHLEQAARLEAELHGRADPALPLAAVASLERCGHRALERADYRAAEGFANRAMALPGLPPERTIDIQVLLLESHIGLTDPRMLELGRRLEIDARAADRPEVEGLAIFAQSFDAWVGPTSREGGAEAARELLERADALLRDGTPRWRALVVTMLGYQGWWYGDLAEAERRWGEVREIGREAGDLRIEADALRGIARVRGIQGATAEADRLFEEALGIADRSGSRLVGARVQRGYAAALADRGELEEARHLAELALPVFEEAGDDQETELALGLIAEAMRADGRTAEAIPLLERGLAAVERIGHGGRIPEANRSLAEAYLELGQAALAEPYALRGTDTVGAGDWSTVATTKTVLGRVRDAQGRDDEAERLLLEGATIIGRTDYRNQYWEAFLPLAEFYFRRGRTDEATVWLDRARESLGAPPPPGRLAYVERRAAAARGAQPRDGSSRRVEPAGD
jgi:tetratricopeptide (TPR) repeat protein